MVAAVYCEAVLAGQKTLIVKYDKGTELTYCLWDFKLTPPITLAASDTLLQSVARDVLHKPCTSAVTSSGNDAKWGYHVEGGASDNLVQGNETHHIIWLGSIRVN